MQSQAKNFSFHSVLAHFGALGRICGRVLAVLATWFAVGEVGIAGEPGGTRQESAYARAVALAAGTNSVSARWQLARAAFDLAEVTLRDKEKARLAEVGRSACRAALAEGPASAPAHYYLALCTGELAQTKLVSGLRLIHEIELEFESARVLDEGFDFGGPDRGLGLLYLEAPGWPTSVGDRKKARSHLERAVALAPEYPENRLGLLEVLVRTKDQRAAAIQLKAIEALWPRAREQFRGDDWAASWKEWEQKKTVLAAKLDRLTRPPKPPGSPRSER
jgi:hypothetical protein